MNHDKYNSSLYSVPDYIISINRPIVGWHFVFVKKLTLRTIESKRF